MADFNNLKPDSRFDEFVAVAESCDGFAPNDLNEDVRGTLGDADDFADWPGCRVGVRVRLRYSARMGFDGDLHDKVYDPARPVSLADWENEIWESIPEFDKVDITAEVIGFRGWGRGRELFLRTGEDTYVAIDDTMGEGGYAYTVL